MLSTVRKGPKNFNGDYGVVEFSTEYGVAIFFRTTTSQNHDPNFGRFGFLLFFVLCRFDRPGSFFFFQGNGWLLFAGDAE